MASSPYHSGNGVGVATLSAKKKKRKTVKLSCIIAILLAPYVIFVYFVHTKFDSGKKKNGDGNNKKSSAPSLRTGNNSNTKPDQPSAPVVANKATVSKNESKELSLKGFCGLCKWKDQGFNCNERVEWVVREKGEAEIVAKKTNLPFCYNPSGCSTDNVNDEGFLECNNPEEEGVPTIRDFCGMCKWKDQGFNCNERVEWVVKQKEKTVEEAKKAELRYCFHADGCKGPTDDEGFMTCELIDTRNNKPPPNYKVGTTEHVEKEPELEAVLSGSLLREMASRDVLKIVDPNSITKHKENEEGLRDRRKGEDIVHSVLSAAKYGDRQYDTPEDAEFSKLAKKEGAGGGGRHPDMPVLTAYCEPVNQTAWETKPLPRRDGPATKSALFPIEYPHMHTCSALPSQWPIDTPPTDLDPFLPWIHDVFPSSDGKFVVFVAQNRRRCYNGQRMMRRGEQAPKGVTPHKGYMHIDYQKNYFMRPQSALFQHVPVKRIENSDTAPEEEEDAEPRFRLSSHEEADEDGVETRFICRYKRFDPDATPKVSIVGYTLAQHEVDYDYHTYRKGYKHSATPEGYDNHMIWQSHLMFKCPVPFSLHEEIKNGDTVVDDYATLYVDLIPIRTAPRYTPPAEFLQPRYGFTNDIENLFLPDIEWGKEHVLPKIDESGRWENIPICLPSLMEYGLVPKGTDIDALTIPENEPDRKYVAITGENPPKIHKTIACTWASTTFKTRQNRAMVGDGKRRLQEWLEFNLLSGFDHIYVYDNSGAFTNDDSLADIIDLFGEKVTRIDWPCKICSNRDGNEGERSSQYAAESSCRLRFGVHARWLGSFDSDEYLVPMGEFSSMGEVADEMDRKGVKVAAFKAAPAKPRFDLLEDPEKTEQADGSFTPTVTSDESFLHTYNCNWEPFPRKNDMSHRRKQMYRADYVKLHYVHYSTITVVSQMTAKQTKSSGESWMHRYVERHVHEFDEDKEATMLHTKTKVARNMPGWKQNCKRSSFGDGSCHLGFPVPKDIAGNFVSKDQSKVINMEGGSVSMVGKSGYGYNCFVNEKIDDYWWPRLVEAVEKRKKQTQLT